MNLQDPEIEESRRLLLIVARGDAALLEAAIQAEFAQCGSFTSATQPSASSRPFERGLRPPHDLPHSESIFYSRTANTSRMLRLRHLRSSAHTIYFS